MVRDAPREFHGVCKGLVGALTLEGRHRVRRVTDQRHALVDVDVGVDVGVVTRSRCAAHRAAQYLLLVHFPSQAQPLPVDEWSVEGGIARHISGGGGGQQLGDRVVPALAPPRRLLEQCSPPARCQRTRRLKGDRNGQLPHRHAPDPASDAITDRCSQ